MVAPEVLVNRFDQFIPAPPAKIEIDIGQVAAPRIEEALEQQSVAQRIGIRQAETMRHQAVRGRTAPDERNVARARQLDNLMHRQKIRRKPHRLDH